MDDDAYRSLADALYKQRLAEFKLFLGIQAEYGKWLIATLSLLHGAALYALASGHLEQAPRAVSLAFLFGLILTMISGFATWINFSLNAGEAWRKANVMMLFDRSSIPPEDESKNCQIALSLYAAVITGILSLLLFVVGVIVIATSH